MIYVIYETICGRNLKEKGILCNILQQPQLIASKTTKTHEIYRSIYMRQAMGQMDQCDSEDTTLSWIKETYMSELISPTKKLKYPSGILILSTKQI